MTKTRKGYILTLVCVSAWLAASGQFVAAPARPQTNTNQRVDKKSDDGRSGQLILHGRYVSSDYGFSVRVPDSLTASTDLPPQPQHGIRIDLANKGDFVWVVGNYNAAEYTSADDALKVDLERLERDDSQAKMLRKSSAKLGNLAARRIVNQYRDNSTGIDMIEDSIVALRSSRGMNVFYQLGLVSRAERYEANKRIFDRIINSWRITKIAQ